MHCNEEGARLSNNKRKNTWTRLVCMDVGSVGIIKEGTKSILGKRIMLDVFTVEEVEDENSK